MPATLDLRIDGGSVIDGTGKPAFAASVGVRDGRIVEIGDARSDAVEVIDADGLVLAPGFVDMHTHYDAQAFWDPTLSPSSQHGVTTVIGGNCGFSIAPLSGKPADADYLMAMLARVEGMPLDSLKAGVPWDWTSFEDYLGRLDGRLSLNAGFMVGHSAIRRTVMGARAVGERASPAELDAMETLLRQSIEAGGLGLSSTVSRSHNDAAGQPVPSRWASDEELLRLARACRDYEGTTIEFLPDLIGGFDEDQMRRMSDLSLAAGRPLNWNAINPDSGMPEYVDQQLSASDYAAERGARVVGLVFAQCVKLCVNFVSCFVLDGIPGWAPVMALPLAERKRALADPAVRAELEGGMKRPEAGMYRAVSNWAEWTLHEAFSPETKPYQGMAFGEIAQKTGKSPFDAMLDIVLADDLKTMLSPPVRGDDDESWRMRARAWADDRTVIGASDAGAHLDMINTFAFSSALLATGVRDKELIGLEEAVRQLTEKPARLMGLKDRGVLREGYWADLVLFDADTIGPGPIHTRFDMPGGAGRLYADALGVARVIVNGRTIVRDGQVMPGSPGRILRSGRDTYTVGLDA